MKAPAARQFYLYWLPPLVVTAGILVFSGELGSAVNTERVLAWLLSWLPLSWSLPTAESHSYLRKIGHITVYGSLYWLWFRAFQARLASRRGIAVLVSLGLCLMIALADEGRQYQVASRSGTIRDVALDFGAATLAALALSFKSR